MPVRPWWYDKWWQGKGQQKDANGVGGDYAHAARPKRTYSVLPKPKYSVGYSRPWYINARWWLRIRFNRAKMIMGLLLASLLKVIIIAILISVGGLTAYHWSEGADITDAFRLTTWDFRFATKCYGAPSTIPKFVQVNDFRSMVYVTLGGETVDNYLSRNCIELRRRGRLPQVSP